MRALIFTVLSLVALLSSGENAHACENIRESSCRGLTKFIQINNDHALIQIEGPVINCNKNIIRMDLSSKADEFQLAAVLQRHSERKIIGIWYTRGSSISGPCRLSQLILPD